MHKVHLKQQKQCFDWQKEAEKEKFDWQKEADKEKMEYEKQNFNGRRRPKKKFNFVGKVGKT